MQVNLNFKEKLKKFWTGWGYSVLIALIIATSFKSAIADWNVVPTGSMKPTIVEGDRIFVNKLAYDFKVPYTTVRLARWANPQRGDIVVFFSPADGKRLVKRVVGIPGDTISMRKNRLSINGKTLSYEAVQRPKTNDTSRINRAYRFVENLVGTKHPIMIAPRPFSQDSFRPLTVPDDAYFMLGDNRDNSADSRYFGFVKRKQVVGKATAVVASLDRSKYYKPRWDRFFTRLP
jgi:signal peptidase I